MSELNYNNNLNNKDNSKKKVLLIVIPIITALFVIGGFVGHKIYNKSIDDTSTDTTVAESEVTEENIISEQTHPLTRETKHTTKKMDYIPGMPSSDYKKMKEAPTTTEVAKEDAKEETTTEETTVATTKKTSTEQTTQAPKETPTEQPKETPTEQPTEAPAPEPSTEAPKKEEPDLGERVEGNTNYGHYETKTETYEVDGYRADDGTFFEDEIACDNYAWEHNIGWGTASETRTREVQVWVWDR